MATITSNVEGRPVRIISFLHQVDTNVRALLKRCISLGGRVIWVMSTAAGSIKEFLAKYPAVLSGYIIYIYLFITIMRFFLKAKSRQVTLYDIYETFDALPFMWLLSSALVKIIDMRTKLHDSEKERIQNRRELEIKQTQVDTMHEVAIGFQHRVNNPLAIISLSLSGTKRAAAGNPMILERMRLIQESAGRIHQAVIDFSRAEKYEVEYVGPNVGSMASPLSGESSA